MNHKCHVAPLAEDPETNHYDFDPLKYFNVHFNVSFIS